MKNAITILILGALLSGCISTTAATWNGHETFLIRKEYATVSTPEGPRKLMGGACLKLKLTGDRDVYRPGEFSMDMHNCNVRDEDVRYLTSGYQGSVKIDRSGKWIDVDLYYGPNRTAFELNGKYSFAE